MSEAALQWIRDGLTVLFGALAGGVTNRIAIVMLFHPYKPPRLFGREVSWLQGAVPKNQSRLASTIGRTIGTRLLTPEDVAAELQDACRSRHSCLWGWWWTWVQTNWRPWMMI